MIPRALHAAIRSLAHLVPLMPGGQVADRSKHRQSHTRGARTRRRRARMAKCSRWINAHRGENRRRPRA